MRNTIAAALIAISLLDSNAARAQSSNPIQLAMPRIAIVRVYVPDLAKGEEFYRAVFGLTPGRGSNQRERVLGFSDNSTPVIIVAQAQVTPTTPDGLAPFAVIVRDFDDLLKRVVAAGGTIVSPPRSLGADGRFALVKDPYGTQIEIIGAPS
jgi:predicted enzyme related to lactoylglutathione lyase